MSFLFTRVTLDSTPMWTTDSGQEACCTHQGSRPQWREPKLGKPPTFQRESSRQNRKQNCLIFVLREFVLVRKQICLLPQETQPPASKVICCALVLRSVAKSCLTLEPHGLRPTRLLCPWNSPGKDAGVGCHFLLQGIFPTQGSDLYLLHWQEDSLPLSQHP